MELKGKKILVTGGAGFIGSNFVDGLIAAGNKVTVLDDFSTGKRENLQEAGAKVNIVDGSILNYGLVKDLIRQNDVVYHLAVQCLRVCFDKPHLVHEVNATGTLNLLQAAQELKDQEKHAIERFVYVSSSEVYGTAKTAPMKEEHELSPTTVYGASKLAGELYTKAYFTTYGMPTMILRPFNTYGFREHHEGASGEVIPRFVVRILNGKSPIIFGDGTQTRDFTFVTDTVKGLMVAGSHDGFLGQEVNIACGKEVTIKYIADYLLKAFGAEKLGIQWEPERPGDVHRHFADVTKLNKATGFKAGIQIEEGMGQYINWFKAKYPNPAKLLEECQTHNWKLSNAEVLTTASR